MHTEVEQNNTVNKEANEIREQLDPVGFRTTNY